MAMIMLNHGRKSKLVLVWKGFSTESGGFNSGMKQKFLVTKKCELRTVTNPKVTYGLDGHEGPADSRVKERGSLGTVDKNRPDTYFVNSPERYLTTTGLEKAQTARGIEELKAQNRLDTTVEYGGVAGRSDHLAAKAPENYRDPRHPHTFGELRGKAQTSGGAQPATDGDYGRLGHKVLPNNRAAVKSTDYGAVTGIMGAVIAPIMDVLRPSKRHKGNIRLSEMSKKWGWW